MSAALTASFALSGVSAFLGCLALSPAHAETGPEGSPSSSAAWQWIRSQLETGTAVSSPSTIAGARPYDPSWTGAVSGSFTLRGTPTPRTISGTPLVIDSPDTLAGDYRGVVTGHLDLPRGAGRWIVNVVRLTPAGTEQASLQALADADGAFTLDLAGTVATTSGEWGFQVLDAAHGYRQEGATWPQPDTFDGLVVRAVVVTDTAYVIGEVPANADHTFSFGSSRPGAKVFQLVETATGGVLAEQAPDTGLVRSYDAPAGQVASGRAFTYDQALALITAQSIGDTATAARLARGLMRLQTTGGPNDGAFVTSAAALHPEGALPEYRTGNHSLATYALLRHLRSLPPTDPDRTRVSVAASKGVDWLLAHQVPSGLLAGLVTGGEGQSSSDGSFDPSIVMPWASTEHNLDAWHTLRLASSVLDRAAADHAADRLATAIVTRLWDASTGRFLQGWQPEGPDPTQMLDLNSWGAIFLQKTGRLDQAAQALAETQVFASIDPPVAGYGPRSPATSPVVWFEGSAGVALAQNRLGHSGAAATTLGALDDGQLPSGAFPEASRVDHQMDMTMAPAVAATAWILLARQAVSGQPTIWDE